LAGLVTANVAALNLPDDEVLDAIVRSALAEDLAGGVDVTSEATIPAAQRGRALVVAREAGVVAGLPLATRVLTLAARGEVELLAADGDRVLPGQPVLTVAGPLRGLLTAERTMLNLLCHLSGIATLTRRWVDAVDGTGAAIRDTRKTLPGLRALEKYAVRCGGGLNHRMSLSDAALVKDNHVAATGSVVAAFRAVRAAFPDVPVEVECDTIDQVAEAIAAGADLVLLDNMDLSDLRTCVAMARPAGVLLEASGGLTLDQALPVAQTGVHYLAVGALTHSAPALDLGFDVEFGDGSASSAGAV
jgi:nicotinate-nucleotide pyrophosphorylase (carboxylating)